ncbi:cytochrome c [Pseudoroseomonas wenyumeiae]|uniref:Cytochrome c n=1 Tax=Teichococcus wenyumeiae TaxID=2478470 RepID=A0A3A9JL69_9PROT|nr:cytochrome c [Pseudoroseomonas wenyumeiae]RKK01308.1 cytochrome c [Pseudoroseomonas wenyumeiae]RMI26447.1 cytochrome c [Pseudoroseomonas wenyumeiae]
MKRLLLPVGLLALALGAAGSGGAWAQADVVGQRKEEMKRSGAHLEAIKKIMDAGEAVGPVAPRAQEMHGYFATLPTLFPAGSTENSKARPEVWSDRAGFEKAASNASEATAKLAAAAGSGDRDATAAAFREVGASCGACHRNYRAR